MPDERDACGRVVRGQDQVLSVQLARGIAAYKSAQAQGAARAVGFGSPSVSLVTKCIAWWWGPSNPQPPLIGRKCL